MKNEFTLKDLRGVMEFARKHQPEIVPVVDPKTSKKYYGWHPERGYLSAEETLRLIEEESA